MGKRLGKCEVLQPKMQKQKNSTHLVWFRNDLRVRDNAVLQMACDGEVRVICLYCLDPRHFSYDRFGFQKTAKFRAKFLLETLEDLKTQLLRLNISLLLFHEKPEEVIPRICKDFDICSVFSQKEWTQEEFDVEKAIRASLPGNISWHTLYNQFLFHPEDLNFEISKTDQVFTEFRKKLEKNVPVREEVRIVKLPKSNLLESDQRTIILSDLGFEDFALHPNSVFPFKGGETQALERLDNYFFRSKKLGTYKKTRNGLIGVDYSSKCSPWLANGSLSARTVYHKVRQFEQEHYKNQSTYWMIFELIWRDYFKCVSMKHGNQIFQLGGILRSEYEWKTDSEMVRNWIDGNTGSDFVDANMLELKKTGWMSNRGRQNVASYFAKDLQLDWRIGAAYFESQLIDYDVHSNYGNWMYVAGVGNDPRDRKFNVELQAKRYDPGGQYRKLWLKSRGE